MFWALFALGSAKHTDLEPFHATFTQTMGTLLYGVFHIATLIILLNMLIAMMAKSYERILVFFARLNYY
jgi:hypothetical protein